MNTNNFHCTEKHPSIEPQRPSFSVEINISGEDIVKSIAIIGGAGLSCLLIICAHSAGLMAGLLFLVGVVVFLGFMVYGKV